MRLRFERDALEGIVRTEAERTGVGRADASCTARLRRCGRAMSSSEGNSLIADDDAAAARWLGVLSGRAREEEDATGAASCDCGASCASGSGDGEMPPAFLGGGVRSRIGMTARLSAAKLGEPGARQRAWVSLW
jgi:hypothetical protein